MLAELNVLVPKGRREKVERQLVQVSMDLNIKWDWVSTSQLGDELHKSVWRRFEKRTVFAKQVDDILTDLVDRLHL